MKQFYRIFIFVLIITMLFSTTAFAHSGPGTINADGVNMRKGPSINSEIVTVLYYGETVNVHGSYNEWYEIDYNGSIGYVYSPYITLGELDIVYNLNVNNFTSEIVTVSAPSAPTQQETSTTLGQNIVDTAIQYLGVPYVWGGESIEEGGFDCSGLVYAVYQQNDIEIDRIVQLMIDDGVEADLNNPQLGDILLFGSSIYNVWHTGLYIGNSLFIHSPGGSVVKIENLNDLHGMSLISARRVI